MSLVVLLLCLQGSPEYFLDREPVSLNDIVDTGGRLYVRAKRLEEPLGLLWRVTLDGGSVGVYRDKFGGAVFPLGNGKDALFHSKALFFSFPALERGLGISIEQKGMRTTLQSGKKMPPEPKRTGLISGDRMVDLELPSLKNPDRVHSLSKKRRGKRILLFFWAPWDSSRDLLLQWQGLYRRLKRYDLVVIGIALDAQGVERAREHLSRKVTFPVLSDTRWRSAKVLTVGALPSWALIDERGFLCGMGRDMGGAEKAFARLGKPRGGKRSAWIQDQEGKMAELLPGSRWKAIAEAASLWKAGRNPEGIGVLAEYLKRNEGDLLLRYQKWSVEFAERMHGEVLDPVWLKAQEKKERTGG